MLHKIIIIIIIIIITIILIIIIIIITTTTNFYSANILEDNRAQLRTEYRESHNKGILQNSSTNDRMLWKFRKLRKDKRARKGEFSLWG